ncbi:hypothetical protein IMY05_C4852000300 [Salix suchowensis]|nr:hypothetical protein IMY05_C4852000300 [Salix suchowensis]
MEANPDFHSGLPDVDTTEFLARLEDTDASTFDDNNNYLNLGTLTSWSAIVTMKLHATFGSVSEYLQDHSAMCWLSGRTILARYLADDYLDMLVEKLHELWVQVGGGKQLLPPPKQPWPQIQQPMTYLITQQDGMDTDMATHMNASSASKSTLMALVESRLGSSKAALYASYKKPEIDKALGNHCDPAITTNEVNDILSKRVAGATNRKPSTKAGSSKCVSPISVPAVQTTPMALSIPLGSDAQPRPASVEPQLTGTHQLKVYKQLVVSFAQPGSELTAAYSSLLSQPT